MARELAALGERPRIEGGGVSWNGDARSLARANLWLRTASRVLVRLARFEATKFYELERQATLVDWARFVAPGVDVAFRVTARKSKLYHSDAIAERLLAALPRPSVKPERRARTAESRKQLFVVRVVRDQFEISADSSGELLHMRGYRQAVAKAPLRETLAAALILAADWTGNVPLMDPLCGAGTLPIEAALIARRVAPGIARTFAFEHWPAHDLASWDEERVAARDAALPASPVPLIGSDRDAGAIDAARANAERAGVTGDIDFTVRALSAMAPPDQPGLVIANPPYGKRVSSSDDPRNLYAQLGKTLRGRCRGWQFAVYSPEARFTAQLALPTHEFFRTSNGGIRVTAVGGIVG